MVAQLLFSRVMHCRLLPKRNHFNYGLYYLAIPLNAIDSLPLARNRFSLLSFYDRDHGKRDGSCLADWAQAIFAEHQLDTRDGQITLVCMPRVLGYVFNPVSFWLYRNRHNQLLAVLCEVNNTFGERHTYLCARGDGQALSGNDILQGKKVFHVSPMLERDGNYQFRFDISEEKFNIWIDFINAKQQKQLITSLKGDFAPMTKPHLRKAFWGYPLLTFKVITLIHWQALKLLAKGIQYLSKPLQQRQRVSTAHHLIKPSPHNKMFSE